MFADFLSRMLVCVIVVSGAVSTALAEDGEFKRMFDGRTLDGWVIEGSRARGIWSVTKDGELYCKGKGYGFLRYDKKLCDFEIQLEYKMGPNCNSGIGIRSKAFKGGGTRPSASGYELQILADAGKKPNNHSSMSLYRHIAPTVNASLPSGEWNKFAIVCRGPNIKVTLNDQVVQDIDQTKYERLKNKPLCGYFSVQNHNKDIWYRNMRLREIKPEVPKE